MTTSLIMTVIGRDRPGLVRAISEKIAAFDGNWLETRMASLAGEFAGILRVAVPQAKADALIAALQSLESEGLRLIIEKSIGEPPMPAGRTLNLALIGQDRRGIVRDISGVLAERGISIEELETENISGPFSGENMFKARARMRVPEQITTAELRSALEVLGNELMVDVTLDEAAAKPLT